MALCLFGCEEKEPENIEPEKERIEYEYAFPARLNLPVIRDDFGVFNLVWEKSDEPELIDAGTGKTVGRLENTSGAGETSGVFQICTDLTSGRVFIRFGGKDSRIAPGFSAESEPFDLSPRLTTADMTVKTPLVRVKLNAAKGTKMFGAEFNSLQISGNGFNLEYKPEKPVLIKDEPVDILVCFPAADMSGKDISLKLDTFLGKADLPIAGKIFKTESVSCVRIVSDDKGWKVSDHGKEPETYTFSSEISDSQLYSVRIGDALQKVYPAKDYHVCTFGSDTPVTVEVTSSRDIESFSVRPLNKGYKAVQIDSRTISFELEPYGRASVELNGSIDTPLFVFANPLTGVFEEKVSGLGSVVRVKAGEVHNGSIYLKSGQGLIIEGGGVVKGKVGAANASGVRIVGGGIIDGWEDFTEHNGMRIQECTDAVVAGVTIICNTGRAFWTYNSSGLVYDGVKVLGTSAPSSDERQTDAMDLYGVRNAKITRCFAFSNDDNYCIKTWKWGYKAETNFIDFEDCIAWNYRGNGFEIGYETGLDVHDISYKDIYSIRSSCGRAAASFRRGAVSIHGAASGTISNISYDGVYIEDPWEGGLDMRILKSSYELGTGEVWGPGIIKDVKMKNVKMEKMPVEGQSILGYDSTHRISLEIENLEIAGKKIKSASEGKFKTNAYVDMIIR